ncbi:N-acetylmuramoyl-L-alanine amidase [Limimaricola pyoseonensis]|uniref:N-acetylmuramoyl-L-alanine amidase n=1 Tax=Limimaricola pyoseonensis TaxID=521013 RepID=A0A1G7GNX2_9RHOB|nr:N-acetylmuramoyl-L-alanine amidase [Limimaricola pyoseonensis]SDE89837.1 N-acetylmuramoyl-L-alanine amidase [Limimaricola pyoseonensis]
MSYLPDRRVTTIVIHYSATPIEKSYTATDIDAMHRARGFNEIGYHYFIRRDGTVETGRDLSHPGRFEVGAHSQGENASSIGVCYEGGVRASAPNTGFDSRTPEQIEAMIALIRELLKRFPGAVVRGHREMPAAATQCPGFLASAWWDHVMRAEAAPEAAPMDVQVLRWRLAEVRDRATAALASTPSDPAVLKTRLSEIRERITDRIGR